MAMTMVPQAMPIPTVPTPTLADGRTEMARVPQAMVPTPTLADRGTEMAMVTQAMPTPTVPIPTLTDRGTKMALAAIVAMVATAGMVTTAITIMTEIQQPPLITAHRLRPRLKDPTPPQPAQVAWHCRRVPQVLPLL